MKYPFVVLLILIILTVIIGILTRNSGVLMLSIPMIAYLIAAVYQRPEQLNLTIMREITPQFAPQGTPITVKVTIVNEGASLDEVVIRDLLPDGVTLIDGKPETTALLEANSTIEIEYTIEAQRGEYRDYDIRIHATDFSGFFELSGIYQTDTFFTTHPEYQKLEPIKVRPPQTRGFAGPIPARQGGTGTDFWSIREYQTGDSQRHINWRLAARSENQLYVNIFERERVADIGLIVDARQIANVDTGDKPLFEYSVHAAAALAERFLDDGNRVSLMLYGSGTARVSSGYGRIQRERILRTLSRAKLNMNYALQSLETLPTQLFPAKSQIVLVTSLLPEDIPVISQIHARGYAVIVISPDPIAYEVLASDEADDFGYRIANAEREFMLRQLKQSGIRVVNWDVSLPFDLAMRVSLAGQPIQPHTRP